MVTASIGVLATVLPATAAAQTGSIGYKGHHFSGTGTMVTGQKNESKLWWNDGQWWAVMWDETAGDNFIYRLNPSTHAWVNTGVMTDNRAGTRSDVLWDGSKLYVASHGFTNTPSTGFDARLYRYSYSAATDAYSLDTGYPVAISNWKSETLVIAEDSTGKLWATWVAGNSVYVNRSLGDDRTWGTPFVLPVADASGLNADDISSVVAFDANKIGIMWSNQNSWRMNFSVHVDGDPETSWSAPEAANEGQYNADDHINLKADGAGRVYAAIKTEQTESSKPLIVLAVRDSAAGSWARHTFGLKTDRHTRPMVLLDEQNRRIHMFATSGEAGGTIYEKTTSMDAISFESGVGTPFLRDGSSADMNDATSTKQNLNGATGLVLMGSNDTTGYYWHNEKSLGPPPAPPLAAAFTGTPTSGVAPLTVDFTDASSGSPTSWQWDFQNDGIVDSTARNPQFTYVLPGTYSVKLTVANAEGSSTSQTRVDYISVGTVIADFTGTPTAGNAPLTVSFTDASSGLPTSWQWDFQNDGTIDSTAQNPEFEYTAPGTYTVRLTVADLVGNTSSKTRVDYVTVGTLAAGFSGTPTSGHAPLTVSFTDTSTGSPTSWQWDFQNDGVVDSTARNPSFTYSEAGAHTVTLTVTDAQGKTSSLTRTDYVEVSPPPPVMTFTPSEDAYVRSISATTNYGSAGSLRVKDGGTTGEHYRTYLKFSVAGLGGAVASAKLRLYVTDPAALGGDVFSVGNDWTEKALTWNTAPSIGGAVLASAGAVTVGTWVELELPAGTFAAGDGTYSLALKSPGPKGGTAWYSSREGVHAPELVLTTG